MEFFQTPEQTVETLEFPIRIEVQGSHLFCLLFLVDTLDLSLKERWIRSKKT